MAKHLANVRADILTTINQDNQFADRVGVSFAKLHFKEERQVVLGKRDAHVVFTLLVHECISQKRINDDVIISKIENVQRRFEENLQFERSLNLAGVEIGLFAFTILDRLDIFPQDLVNDLKFPVLLLRNKQESEVSYISRLEKYLRQHSLAELNKFLGRLDPDLAGNQKAIKFLNRMIGEKRNERSCLLL